MDIKRDKARSLGITAEDLEQTAFSSYGAREISNIYGTTDTYKVILQVEKDFQRYPDQLSSLYLRTGMVKWCGWMWLQTLFLVQDR